MLKWLSRLGNSPYMLIAVLKDMEKWKYWFGLVTGDCIKTELLQLHMLMTIIILWLLEKYQRYD